MRNPRIIRRSECQSISGLSTRWPVSWERLGSSTPPSESSLTWYSSSPSWRLRIWELMTIGASPSSMVTSMLMRARWRWVKETIREVATLTSLPEGVRHTSSRRSTPSRKSIQRL